MVEEVVNRDARVAPQFLDRRPDRLESDQRPAREKPAIVFQKIEQHVLAKIEQLMQNEKYRRRLNLLETAGKLFNFGDVEREELDSVFQAGLTETAVAFFHRGGRQV